MSRFAWLLIVVTACSGSKSNHTTVTPTDDGSPTVDKSGVPAALADYEQSHEIRRWTHYEIAGVELWQVTVVGVADLDSSSVVGVDRSGALVSGLDLFRRVGELDPAALAGRALDMLYGKANGAALDGTNTSDFFPAEQRAIVEPPVVADGTLEFWTVFGEMAPRLTRVRLDLATGKDKRTSAADVLNPPPDPLPPIREKLASKDPAVVVEGLVLVSEYCVLAPDVAALLRHADARVRSTALGILGNLGAGAYVPDIIRLMEEGAEWADRSLAGQKLLYFHNYAGAVEAVEQHVTTAKGQEVSVLRDALEYHRKHPIIVGNRPCERE